MSVCTNKKTKCTKRKIALEPSGYLCIKPMRRLSSGFLLVLFFPAVMILLFFLLQGEFRYLFLDMGDRLLFVWDSDFWKEEIFQCGGFSLWMNSFIVQFFHLPVAGTVIASFLLALSALLSFRIYRRVCRRSGCGLLLLSPLALFPTSFLCLDVLVDSCSFQAVTDYLLMTGIILISVGRSNQTKVLWLRLSMAAVLFMAVGPIIRPSSITGSHRFIYAAYVSLGVCSTAAYVLGKIAGGREVSFGWGIFLMVASSGAVSGTFLYLLEKNRQPRQEQIYQLSYYAGNSQWSYITAVCHQMDMGNYMLLNYANLALSYEGRLLEHWTDYRQDDVQALCIKSDMTPGGMSLLSMIYYRMGNIAAAQDMAFEANQYQETPSLLQMLVRTNLIFGSYSVAEKYIAKLEKTLFYRDWASGMRKYLSDEGVMTEPELASKRKGLPVTDAFMVRDRIIDDLILLLDADSSNTAARDYAIVYLHLSKDAPSLHKFVERFYGTEVLPALSPAMQMGLLAATEGDLEYCRSHGVGDDFIAVYGIHKKEAGR